jgi:hypothetical protein
MVKVQDKEVISTKMAADIKAKFGTVSHMDSVR